MAKTNWQDPKTGEIISPHISGLQEAVGKIEESIGMNTISETDIPLSEVFISNDDRCKIYQAPEGKRNWLLSPTPSIKKNGVIITDDFEIDYGGGAIIFTTPILESDILTADATYTVKIDGNQLSELGNKINQAEQKAKDYTDEQITLVTETGIPKLNVYEYKFYDVPVGTTEIEIPLETFYEATDEVELFINTVPRDSDFFTKVDAVRDENGDLLEKGKVILSNALIDVSKVTIKVWKNIPIGEEGSVSGNIIAVNSIPQNRVQGLSIELNNKVDKVEGKELSTNDYTNGDKTKLNNIGNIEELNTIDKTSLVAAINEANNKSGGDSVPQGVIVMWSGTIANIPQGWALCDGQNSTPNLTDRFIMGATTDATINKTGGQNEVTLTKEQMPAHNHSGSTGSAGEHTHDYQNYGTQASANSTSGSYLVMSNVRYISTTSNGAHTHTFSTNNTGGGQSHENRPAYYTLAFIMKL